MMENNKGLIEKRMWSLLLPCCIAIFLGLLARGYLGELLSNILLFAGVGVACCYILVAGIIDLIKGKI